MVLKLCMILFLPLVLTISLLFGTVQGTYQLEYKIEVYADGSATWTVEQKGTNVQTSLDAFEAFIKNVSLLVNVAKEKTQREMMVNTESFIMSASIFDSYKVVRYQFRWEGFAEINVSWIKIGDVFEVENLFSYLYEDGIVCVVYPSGYMIESVSPPPHEHNDSIRMLEWYGISVFGIGEPRLVLKEKSASSKFIDMLRENAILITSLAVLVSGGFISLYYFKFKGKEVKRERSLETPKFPSIPGIEDNEEKVINFLKAAGGSLFQSVISDRCGFSRSKTSKLLKEMEDKGKIKREARGREKVVTLMDETKNRQ